MAIRANFTTADGVFTGEDQALQWTVFDEVTGAAKDITGWSIQFKLAATQTGAAVVTKSATLTTPLSGITQVALTSTDLGIAAGNYFYTLTRTDASNVQVLAFGTLYLQGRPS